MIRRFTVRLIFRHMYAFLALLDYDSRAHEIESRPSVSQLFLYLMSGFSFQILVVAYPGPYIRTFFSFFKVFEKIIGVWVYEYFSTDLNSQSFKTLVFLKVQPKVLLKFAFQWSSQKLCVGCFKF